MATRKQRAAVRLNALSFQGACHKLQRLQATHLGKPKVRGADSEDKWIRAPSASRDRSTTITAAIVQQASVSRA